MGLLSTSSSYFAFSALHLACFALALAVCGHYGQDLSNAQKVDGYSDAKWIFAIVVGSLSALTCVVFFIPAVPRHAGAVGAAWTSFVFFLWVALFAVFGSMYIQRDAFGDPGIRRMKNLLWVDLTSALLWLFSAIGVAVYWSRHDVARSRFTGRAEV